MMKKLLILGILFLLIFITGCSNGHNTDINKADNSYKKVEKKSLPTKSLIIKLPILSFQNRK